MLTFKLPERRGKRSLFTAVWAEKRWVVGLEESRNLVRTGVMAVRE
jgi:hypothetical protein